jgi:uncharacterized membrane protein YkvA (DUF1232 family)
MKKIRKPKSGRVRKAGAAPKSVKRRIPYQKPAIRSGAFAQAVEDAKTYVNEPERLRVLFENAVQRAADIPREQFKEMWPYFQAMLRLIRAYYRGEYRQVPPDALILIVAAISYVVNPFDLIPDEIPFLGFLDDATVITFAVRGTKKSLDDFMTWETATL